MKQGVKPALKKLAGYKDNDVELCRTTNQRVSRLTMEALLEEQIPFTGNQKRIPFFQRDKYKGATQVWVISINPRRYGQARRVLDGMDRECKKRLVLTNF